MSNRPAYSAVVKFKRTTSPHAKVLPAVTKPQFHYDEADTQAWPTLSSASPTTKNQKEVSRKDQSSCSEVSNVDPTLPDSEVIQSSDIPLLALECNSQASLNPSPCVTMPGATLTGRKKRRRKSSKATHDQAAADSTRQLPLESDVASDQNNVIGSEVREKSASLPLNQSHQVPTPQLPTIPVYGPHQSVGTAISTQLEKSVLSPVHPSKFEIGNVSSTPTLTLPQQESSSFNISEQQAKKTQRVTPPPGMENTTNEIVRYRTKFMGLLRDEESEHEKQLYRITCGPAVYHLVFLTDYDYKGDSVFMKHAYISGLQNHEIAYVTQASENEENEGIEIKVMSMETTLKAHILRDNHHHIEDKLYIGFKSLSQTLMLRHSQKVTIKFLLKTSYFRSLHMAIKYLPEEIILRITSKGHQCIRMDKDTCYNEIFKKSYDLDNEQYRALSLILAKSCPNELPLIIDGPFGTGKTYVLAAAANALFQSKNSIRILVCTQQQKSAEHFLEIFTTKLAALFDDGAKKILLRDRAINACRPTVKNFIVRSYELRNQSELLSATDKLLIVTTCSSAHYLRDINFEFTHIFIDEGAQMREPEAIGALRMAKKDTKIVIAGDPHQVGPAMLVLGEEARKGGLDKSLLERLLLEYSQLDKANQFATCAYRSTLVTNYRCHKSICRLSKEIFYPTTPLKVFKDDKPQIIPLNDSQTSLHFLCCNVEDLVETSFNKTEASAVVTVLRNIVSKWPHHGLGKFDASRICIMSKSRSQLNTIRGCVPEDMRSLFKGVLHIPTFDMQGKEYCALVMSTLEPLKEDGSPSIDPSKSLSNPYVFNTANTRAESLVVGVGNPFLLLKTEEHMVAQYGAKGNCWSRYLKHCIENGTLKFTESLRVNEKVHTNKLKILIGKHLGKPVHEGLSTSEHHTTFLERDYRVEDKLGDGGFGLVLRVTRLSDKQILAIKLKICNNTDETKKQAKEANALADFRHVGIVRYYNSGLAKSPDWEEWKEWKMHKLSLSSSSSPRPPRIDQESDSLCFYILTEWCEKGTLRDWLDRNMQKENRKRVTIFEYLKQILQALDYIHHESRRAHRDLKPSNIFFSKENVLKIGDFGFVKDVYDQTDISEEGVSGEGASASRSLSKQYGTGIYRSPEVYNRQFQRCTNWRKVDMYAVGVIYFELCWIVRRHERDRILDRLFPKQVDQEQRWPSKFDEEHCKEATELINKLTSYDPTERPTAQELLEPGGIVQAYQKKISKRVQRKDRVSH